MGQKSTNQAKFTCCTVGTFATDKIMIYEFNASELLKMIDLGS